MISYRAASVLLSALLLFFELHTAASATSVAHAVLHSDDGFTYSGDAEVVAPPASPIVPALSTVGSIVMQIPQIPGSSNVPGYPGAFDVYSLAFGVSVTVPTAGTGQPPSKPVPTIVSVQKDVDAATPLLELTLLEHRLLPNHPIITLLHTPGYVPLAKVDLTDAYVSADSLSGSAGSQAIEAVSFAYSTLTYCIDAQNPDGSAGAPVCSAFQYSAPAVARRHLPRAGPAALVPAGQSANPSADSSIYSTRVAFRGSDGHSYAGDAVVYPSRLFPVTRATTGFRSPAAARARALSSGPFRFDSLFQSPRRFDVPRGSYPKLDYLLFVPGIHGFSAAPGHSHWMDVQSFSISLSLGSSNQIVASDFDIQKQTDASSPLLWRAVNRSTFLQDASHLTFQVWEQTSASTGLICMSLTFTNPIADSYGFSASYGPNATDMLSFAYSKVQICQYPSVTTGKQGSPACNVFTRGS